MTDKMDGEPAVAEPDSQVTKGHQYGTDAALSVDTEYSCGAGGDTGMSDVDVDVDVDESGTGMAGMDVADSDVADAAVSADTEHSCVADGDTDVVGNDAADMVASGNDIADAGADATGNDAADAAVSADFDHSRVADDDTDMADTDMTDSNTTNTDMIPRGTVVLAATPIGNTGDASDRLKALLEHADIVAAEDTRRLYDLARRLGVYVNGRVVAYHDHNERNRADGLLDEVESGATVLVVSDAGMPTINDPGLAIVRRAIERGIPATCAPGPSAVLDALALSGLPTDKFCYEGFLPRRHSERVRYLRTMLAERRTIVWYETLHRIDESMADLLEVFGSDRAMALCRELTKTHEEIRRGTVSQIRSSVEQDPPRGELVLVVAGASDEEAQQAADAQGGSLSIVDLAQLAMERAQASGVRVKDAIAEVAKEHLLADGSMPARKEIYQAVLELKQQ